jgi:hypothetical protein
METPRSRQWEGGHRGADRLPQLHGLESRHHSALVHHTERLQRGRARCAQPLLRLLHGRGLALRRAGRAPSRGPAMTCRWV